MKRIGLMFLSILLCAPCVAWSDTNELLERKAQLERDLSTSMFHGIKDLDEFFSKELAIIEERVKEENPKLVESVKNYSDDIKVIKYNNWYAEQVFNEYRDFFLWRLRERSQESGREIKSYFNPSLSVDFQSEYWLDRGELDTEKCNWGTYRAKDNTREEVEKELADMREHVCLFPDGFEEHAVYLREEDFSDDSTWDSFVEKKIWAIDDSIKDGWHVKFDVLLTGEWDLGDDTNLSRIVRLVIGYDLYDYKEYHNYRNQEHQDIKDGMFSYMLRDKKKCETLGDCRYIVGIEDPSKWKSSISPGWSFKQIQTNHETFISK